MPDPKRPWLKHSHPMVREDDRRQARERRRDAFIANVLKEDLGGKVTEAEWAMLQIAADLKLQVDALTWRQRTKAAGRKLQMDLVRVLGRLRSRRKPRMDQ